jgi:hypothetical protein
LLDALRRHRDAQSEAYRERARGLASPCLAGCWGCCHQLVLVELPDALLIARHLLATGAATPGLRSALDESATLARRLTPDEFFASAAGCAFLDRAAPAAACSIYPVRPNDCRIWYVHGVPDGAACRPGAPVAERERRRPLDAPDLEEADLRHVAHWSARFFAGAGVETRPVWAPLGLATLAALDVLERGPGALRVWQGRLDDATQRSFALVDEVDEA